MCIAKRLADNMLQIINEVDLEVKRLQTKLQETTMAQQDILHIIELSNFNACEGYLYAKRLKEIREERRIYKEEMLRMKSLKIFVDNNKNKFKSELGNVISRIKNIESKDRIYTSRVDRKVEVKNGNVSDLKKLQQVNQVPGLTFKRNKKQERLDMLFAQISNNQNIAMQ